MELTATEQAMLDGEHGHGVKKSMQILTALGKIFGAKRLIPVKTVQISGVSYDNLGDAGLEYLDEMASDGRVKVRTTLNPAGMDLQGWESMGIPEDFAVKQKLVVKAFERMGASTTCSCTPYLLGNVPDPGDHIAWGESSAVTFANSVLGAYTNKEGGPSSIASALTGVTPEYGLHLDENRQPHVSVEVTAKLRTPSDFGVVGRALGQRLEGRIPLIRGVGDDAFDPPAKLQLMGQSEQPEWSRMKAMCAAIVTFGGAPIFHMEGVSPAKDLREPEERWTLTQADFDKAVDEMNDQAKEVDFIFLGCPHLTLSELANVAQLLEGKKVVKELWLGVARGVKEKADELGYSETITKAGGRLAPDTCHVVAPLKGRWGTIATNSAKGVYYGRAKNKFKTRFGSMEACVRYATGEAV